MTDLTPKTLAMFMAQARETNPKQPGESDEAYRQRLYITAHPAFEQYMRDQHAKYVRERIGEHADTRDRLARQCDGFSFSDVARWLHRTVPPLPNETSDQFRHRIIEIARELEALSYETDDWRGAVAERIAASEARAQRARAGKSVMAELMEPKNVKLRHGKIKYQWKYTQQ